MSNVYKLEDISFKQQTLASSFTVIGTGLHTGLKVIMTVMPAEIDTGYTFIRRDVASDRAEVHARWNNVIDTRLSTTLGNSLGVRVSTVEHILAALYGCGIDNAHIVLDAPEVPIMDGSAKPYVSIINKIGLVEQDAPRRAILIKKPVYVGDGEKEAWLLPSSQPWIEMDIDFDRPIIGKQKISLPLNNHVFSNEIADARTFGFHEQVATLQKLGLAKGGSLRNAVLLKDNIVMNEEGLRYVDEFVRHKYLDAVGDLSLMGARFVGKYVGKCSGHSINNALLRELMLNDDCWDYVNLKDVYNNRADLETRKAY
jgi:UDP-3-O-[3-hydroxymyristoyl] N-acetylglucosamine deacetylase